MRVFNYFFTIFLAVNVLFAGLYAISETQKFTGVRVYLLKKIDTDPPKILFESHIDGERVDAPFVDIRASITDNQTASWDIITEGIWFHRLSIGLNPIVISARDQSGNIASEYIILERKQ